jgi:hypothetical protein
VKKSTAVILSVAKDLRSWFLFKGLRTTAEMLRYAQHDRFEFFHTFRTSGRIRHRPNDDFLAALESGLGRIAFVHKKYADAERWYGDVVTRFGRSHSAPGAMYWRAAELTPHPKAIPNV